MKARFTGRASIPTLRLLTTTARRRSALLTRGGLIGVRLPQVGRRLADGERSPLN